MVVMIMEQRGSVRVSTTQHNLRKDDIVKKTKPFAISKDLVREAYKRVKANAGEQA